LIRYSLLYAVLFEAAGGWSGIRTHERREPLPVFKTGPFNHSGTHPLRVIYDHCAAISPGFCYASENAVHAGRMNEGRAMADDVILTSIDDRGVATVAINRPAVHNAYNREVIRALIDAFTALAADDSVRMVVLRGNGKHFQAGADLKWVKANRDLTLEENVAVSMDTTNAVRGLNEFPKPTVALVHGGCFGGGVGMVASCDVVIASEDAIFSITEARWGLVAGPILPQLIARMGVARVRRYGLSCERFDARRAMDVGLVDEVCATGALDEAAAPIIEAMLMSGPDAATETKRLTLELAGQTIDDAMARELAEGHAAKRMTDEAVEGLDSFIERRKAVWYPE
jgi:methylglutaconyl-CoA hydratase